MKRIITRAALGASAVILGLTMGAGIAGADDSVRITSNPDSVRITSDSDSVRITGADDDILCPPCTRDNRNFSVSPDGGFTPPYPN